jgi:hypothetical protein
MLLDMNDKYDYNGDDEFYWLINFRRDHITYQVQIWRGGAGPGLLNKHRVGPKCTEMHHGRELSTG